MRGRPMWCMLVPAAALHPPWTPPRFVAQPAATRAPRSAAIPSSASSSRSTSAAVL